MMEKQLYLFKMVDGRGVPFPSLENQVIISTFDFDCKRMGTAPTISASFYHPSCLDNDWTDDVFVTYNGENYFIKNTPSSSLDNNKAPLYKHEVTFVSERVVLESMYFRDGVKRVFSFFGDVSMFADKMRPSLQSVGYDIVVDNDVTSDEFLIEISEMYINNALQYGFERFGIPYYFDGSKKVHFGYSSNVITKIFEYGAKNSLLSIRHENANEKIVNVIMGHGSNENIPYYYPNFNKSGNHDVSTEPVSVESNIESINYAVLDDLTNLREGGSATFYKKTIDPINSDIDVVNIKVDDNSEVTAFNDEWSEYLSVTQTSGHATYTGRNDIGLQVSIIPVTDSVLIINPTLNVKDIDHHENFTAFDYKSIEVKGTYTTTSGDGFFVDIEEDAEYRILDGKIQLPTQKSNGILYSKIVISLVYDVMLQVPILESGNTTYNILFSYDTEYNSTKRGLTVNGTYSYVDDYEYSSGKTITTDYMQLFTVRLVREMAAFSDGYFIPKIMAKFRDIDEYTEFSYSSITIKDENDNSYSYWESDSGIVYFRNQDTRKTYTIKIEIPVTLRLSDYGLAQAADVDIFFENFFGRNQSSNDYFKFHDLTTVHYNKSGIKFIDYSIVNDLDKINFSETVDWIEPTEYLMPSIYRDTQGQQDWYYAENDKYQDEEGNDIVFPNIYTALNPKEHTQNFEDIKPSIVGITNAANQRIDMFQDIAYDENDNNNEWILDENGENQTLKYSFFFVKLRKFDGEHGFNLFNQALETGEMTISMTSGHCGSCNFTIMVNEDGKNTVQVDDNGNLVRDDDGNVKFGSPQDVQQDTSANEVWIALRKEEDSYGIILPNQESGIVPVAKQDTFIISNILMPPSYFLAAEAKLERELIKYMAEHNVDKFNFGIDFSRIYLAENQDVLEQINENSAVNIRYNGNVLELYISSFSYKAEADKALPTISVELTDEPKYKKNGLEIAINQIARNTYNNIKVYQNTQQQGIATSGSAKGEKATDIIVQTTGRSTTLVMSQKAVTDALKAIDSNDVEVTQYMGHSTEKVMSQKAVTNELQKLSHNKVEVVQNTGSSTLSVMSQKATTDTVNEVDNVLPFDGFIDEADILAQTNLYDGGKIYFVKSVNRFAYYREEDGIYTAMWNGYNKYATIIAGQGVIPNSDRIFIYNTQLYLWDGETLVSISNTNMPIEHITTSGTVTLKTDIKYIIKISNDTNFLLEHNSDTKNNHYYKIFLESEGIVPTIEFPSNVLWANEKVFLPNSKYIITIEDNILSYIKVEKPIYYSFNTAFSNDFKVFKE